MPENYGAAERGSPGGGAVLRTACEPAAQSLLTAFVRRLPACADAAKARYSENAAAAPVCAP
ncbi:MAG: hypothetical protein E7554_02385 [Ruminococcaceae bacterium]|nr:hypothetical protein [Oscillospiraceae bacterium]